MSTSITARKLTERNYSQWAVEVEALQRGQGLWKYVPGEMRVPRPLIVPTSGDVSTMPAAPRDPRHQSNNFQPESSDSDCLTRFNHFVRGWESSENHGMVTGWLSGAIIPSGDGIWDDKITPSRAVFVESKRERTKKLNCLSI